MKKLLLILPALLLLASCATVNINSHQLTNSPKKYDSLLVVMTTAEDLFYEWNEENYQYVFFGKFNDLDNDAIRKSMSNSLRRQFHPNKLLFVNDFFPIHKPIPFEEFNSTLQKLNFDAILLVHTRAQWLQEDISDGDMIYRPNTDKHVFLIDGQSFDTVWMGKVRGYGSPLNDFQDLYNRFSKNLAMDLHQKGFIEKAFPMF
ncbi:hypothetical protein A33Q_2733 [Indibacter alkaliphilus LW1]|jgi:hypothetical protein|uniref:Lipoprotein n=1 Tax=Indibacter alkaliphilus (strain CCUG 57479 / KCTC 22604 / LW1) TaxID=1189612 RepID=S2DGD0_INDAL|nr:hypothetical protein [Indibacter alkaliphilus]EOZ96140.1 hypothetical protein A33Q_2733 [Indibacter alkaliphilus LW1]